MLLQLGMLDDCSDCGDGLRLEIADFRVSGRATSGEIGAVTAFVRPLPET